MVNQYQADGLPNITGSTGCIQAFNNSVANGAFYLLPNTDWHGHDGGWTRNVVGFDASRSSSVYKKGLTEARVKNVGMLPILKY